MTPFNHWRSAVIWGYHTVPRKAVGSFCFIALYGGYGARRYKCSEYSDNPPSGIEYMGVHVWVIRADGVQDQD